MSFFFWKLHTAPTFWVMMASRLVPLATVGGSPRKIIRGTVRNDPPPAMTFTTPANRPTVKRRTPPTRGLLKGSPMWRTASVVAGAPRSARHASFARPLPSVQRAARARVLPGSAHRRRGPVARRATGPNLAGAEAPSYPIRR
jgi:hypothetical protein